MDSPPVYQLLVRIRRLFQRLKTVSEKMLEDAGINPSHRAILEFLQEREPHSVPQIAEHLSVSRQHVQVIVNELLAMKLIRAFDNPAHKRSALFGITRSGSALFKSIQKNEAVLLEEIQKQFSTRDLKITLETLQKLELSLAPDSASTGH